MVHNISSFSLLLVLIYMFTRIVRTCSYDMSRWWAPIPLHLLKVSIKYVHPSICNYFTCTLLIYCLTCANLHANSYIEYECVYHIVCFIHTYKCLGMQPQCLGVFQNIGHPTIGEVLATWCSILANLLLDLCWLCVKIIYIYISMFLRWMCTLFIYCLTGAHLYAYSCIYYECVYVVCLYKCVFADIAWTPWNPSSGSLAYSHITGKCAAMKRTLHGLLWFAPLRDGEHIPRFHH